jgi:hypothetical protein
MAGGIPPPISAKRAQGAGRILAWLYHITLIAIIVGAIRRGEDYGVALFCAALLILSIVLWYRGEVEANREARRRRT